MASVQYCLSRELRGHEDDVRRICVCGNAGIASSSRDRTVRFWQINPSNKYDYSSSNVLHGHSSFVGPLAWISPNDDFPEGGLVSGGMDALVLVWDLKTGEKVQILKGHQLQVTGIAIDNTDIFTCSVDCSIRHWRSGETVEAWNAHKAAVQAVMKLPTGELVTGSSDMTMKLWKGKVLVQIFSGHTDTVRDVAFMSGLGLLSASHDGSIRLWALGGEVLVEMVGHTSIVYSVDAHVSGLVVSGSEDCSAKIWKDGVCLQSIEHPGCVWDAKFLQNGDIVTACSDGVVRIWTSFEECIADSSHLNSYASLLSEYKTSRKKVGGLKLDEWPGLESLQVPGIKDGQTKVVRDGDNGVAYSWNAREHMWDKIGEVVDGPDDSLSHPVFDGVQYDYVFDVDVGDGEPIRKLPYNKSDNPYNVADKWLVNETLPLTYREQVVQFILQNSGQSGFIPETSFHDPYTGSSAYVPGGSSILPAAVAEKASFKHIPKKGVLTFEVAQFDGIFKKISDFNSTFILDEEKRNLSLTDTDISRLATIISILKDTSHYRTSKFTEADISVLSTLLSSWPVEMLFPVMDLLRMILLHPDGGDKLAKLIQDGYADILIKVVRRATKQPVLPSNLLTSIRIVINLFKSSFFDPWLQKHFNEVFDAFCISDCVSSSNKNMQLSYSTLILNYAVLMREKRDEKREFRVLSAALKIAKDEKADSDSRFRALVAIGTLMLDGAVQSSALVMDVERIAKAAKASRDTKISEAADDILVLIQQS